MLVLLGIISFALWRNYGVIAKGDFLPLDDIKTNEQKELFEKIKSSNYKNQDIVRTSFGYYQYLDNGWKKIKEVWE